MTWTRGEELIRRYDVPGRQISNAFCAHCGSGLPYVSKTGTYFVVQAGLLNGSIADDISIKNIFCDERADWYDAAVDAPRFGTFPD